MFFWNSLAFFYDPMDVGNLISGSNWLQPCQMEIIIILGLQHCSMYDSLFNLFYLSLKTQGTPWIHHPSQEPACRLSYLWTSSCFFLCLPREDSMVRLESRMISSIWIDGKYYTNLNKILKKVQTYKKTRTRRE